MNVHPAFSITSVNGNATSTNPEETIPVAPDEEAFFDADQITVTNQT